MNFLLFNMTLYGGSLVGTTADNCLKETAFGAKFTLKDTKNIKFEYLYILVENKDLSEMDESDSFLLGWKDIEKYVSGSTCENDLRIIYNTIKPIAEMKNIKMSIDIISTAVSSDEIDLFYTDGSFKKNEIKSSYACCKLREPSTLQLYDEFLREFVGFSSFSGTIDDSTNNIGELTAIKVATEHFGEKQYQLIISDSEYSVKSFREWYYTWKNNNFKNYAKQPIKNETLIKDIYQKMFSQNKIVLLKWTRSHVGNAFNEKCDELAKEALGIEK